MKRSPMPARSSPMNRGPGPKRKGRIKLKKRSAKEFRRIYGSVARVQWIPAFDAVESAGWRVRNMLVWDKMQMGMGMPWRNQHELIVYGKRTPAKIMDGKRGNVLPVARSGNAHHPTEKPVDLIAALISNSEARRVIDPFAGSGTALVAAKGLGRLSIGVEIDERHCETIASRCSQNVLDFGGVA